MDMDPKDGLVKRASSTVNRFSEDNTLYIFFTLGTPNVETRHTQGQ